MQETVSQLGSDPVEAVIATEAGVHQGLKAHLNRCGSAARLKSCPQGSASSTDAKPQENAP
jgi:hypothetical protein